MNARMRTGAGVGVPSILLIVVVLCMTVFASLSLLTAKNDARLTEKTIAATAAYYEADALAQQRLADISEAIVNGGALPEGVVREEGGISFSQPVSGSLEIFVRLDESGAVVQYGLREAGGAEEAVTLDLWK